MRDEGISHGCDHLGVRFMDDTVSSTVQEKINNKADEIFGNAQAKFEKFLKKLGYEWEMGVIYIKDRPSCFGKPMLYHHRAENGCDGCPFETRCDIARKENNL